LALDSTFIRSRANGECHLEVRFGNVSTVDGGRQVFGAVARADADLTALLLRNLETVGRTDITEVTAFTDGCPGLRTALANAGVTKPPILDWFHIAMRLQHTKLAAANLSTDTPDRATATATIVAEVERLHCANGDADARDAAPPLDRRRGHDGLRQFRQRDVRRLVTRGVDHIGQRADQRLWCQMPVAKLCWGSRPS
jgi:hypothetical protein